MPATFKDQLAIVDELLREVERMEYADRRASKRPLPDGYESELRLAGLAQHVAQAYTMMEGVLDFVARRIDRNPVTGEDWHRKLIARCSQPFERPARPSLISAQLASELSELREFRHVVRNIYPTRLDHARVHDNVVRLIGAARSFAAACRDFAARPSMRPAVGKRRRAR